VRFLAEVMRSIADSEANKVENQIDVVPVLQPGAVVEGAVDPADSTMTADESLRCRCPLQLCPRDGVFGTDRNLGVDLGSHSRQFDWLDHRRVIILRLVDPG
jgi:hypothetical protein